MGPDEDCSPRLLVARGRSRAPDDGGMAVPALFCQWSLAVTYHKSNNPLLMLPAFAFLRCYGDGRRTPLAHWLPIALLQAALMFDVVRLVGAASSLGRDRVVIEQFNRVVVLTTLAYVSALWYRLSGMPDAVRAEQSPR